MNPSDSDPRSIPKAALWLGYAGLIPFVVLASALWLMPELDQSETQSALLSYGAIILSFMGAVHWGLAMSSATRLSSRQFGVSVIPALIAWFAVFTPPVINASILIATFTGLWLYDILMAKTGKVPLWYPRLRTPLTLVVVASLIVAQLAVA